VIPWSPLARGRLTRPWQSETTKRVETDFFGNKMYSTTEDADRKVVDALGQLSEKRGIPRAQLALAWLLSKSGVTAPIVGASKPHHLEDAVAALSVKLRRKKSPRSKRRTFRIRFWASARKQRKPGRASPENGRTRRARRQLRRSNYLSGDCTLRTAHQTGNIDGRRTLTSDRFLLLGVVEAD
jgi:hypothetical protein